MNPTRRFLAVSAVSLAALVAAGGAQAWSWSFGGAERVQGNGSVSAETRDVGAFESVALAGSFKVLIRQGASDKVEVKADTNLLPYLETKVVDGRNGRTLEIGTKRGFHLSSSTTPVVTLDMRALRGVALAGSGDVRIEPMKTDAVDVSIAGNGDVKINGLQAERLGLRVSGSGDILANGRANSLNISVAGSGDVKTRDFIVDEAKVSIAGSGDVTVQATKKLNVSIAGSGDVGYVGSPEVSTSNAGSGRVRKLKD